MSSYMNANAMNAATMKAYFNNSAAYMASASPHQHPSIHSAAATNPLSFTTAPGQHHFLQAAGMGYIGGDTNSA